MTLGASDRPTPHVPLGAIGPPVRAAQTLPDSLRAVARDIKLAHSVFALPFAVLGAFLAAPRGGTGGILWARFAGLLALVVVCMVLARTWAMLVNRIADARFDADNPRTAGRALPSGRLSAARARAIAGASAVLFMLAAALFGVIDANWWPALLSGPVLAWIAFYSFTKRFTAWCHLFLGGALAASPIAAVIAVDPGLLARSGTPWWLAGMVLLWVAGFDVIYALQDLEFDRARGLSSIPARLGWRGAAWVSRALHAGALAALVMAWRTEPRFGVVFGVAVALVGVLLVSEHAVLARRGKAGLDMAFFTLNGVVSVLLGLAGVADAWMG